MDFEILDELKSFITPLSGEEIFTLKESLLVEGCRDPLIVWKKNNQERYLIDGHNRYRICTEFKLDYQTIEMSFKSLNEVKDWMVDNQLGRRNLSPNQLSYYRGLKYDRLKQKKGGYDKILSKGQNVPLTSEVLAKEFNVSEKTIKRDSQYSRGIEFIAVENPTLKTKILTGKAKIKKKDIQFLGNLESPKNRAYRNLADLLNEIQILKNRANKSNEAEQIRKQDEQNQAAADYLKETDILFKTKEEQIKRVKARIVSQINNCIKVKSPDSFEQLNKLTSQLKDLVML
ncbi:MAG: hypothetical protein MI975_24900 [Cytophagales bacterium]|nr:hypothetical protein [Cytophagales bacterium]